MVFVAVGGMRGAVSLILAQSVLTMESAADQKHHYSSYMPDGVGGSFGDAEDLAAYEGRKAERKVGVLFANAYLESWWVVWLRCCIACKN